MFLIRFDMRAPGAAADERADLYQAAVDMSVWAEEHGALACVLSEHHASPDGYLPSPLLLASAIAARTTTLPISVSAVLAALHDPVDLAEQMVVLDHLSRGRVSYTLGLGYRRTEYEMFGREFTTRGRRMDSVIEALQAAFGAAPFEFEGRPALVTPPPFTPGGPTLSYGGASVAAARRAGRYGLGFLGEAATPELEQIHREAAIEAGHQPASFMVPGAGSANAVFVAEDVDEGWESYGPYLLHDAAAYGAWMGPDKVSEAGSQATTVAELRAENANYRVVDVDGARALIAEQGFLGLFPLCGGTPPDLAWRSLRLVADRVLA